MHGASHKWVAPRAFHKQGMGAMTNRQDRRFAWRQPPVGLRTGMGAMKPTVILLLVFTVLVSAVSVVQTQHASRKVFMEVEQLKKKRDLLNEEWGRLQLEQSTWAMDERVENMVKEELDMHVPDNGSLVFLVP